MKNIEYPRFIQNKPIGEDKFEGKSAERIADAIKTHINKYAEEDYKEFPKIIGLEGEWGSGKSNIIKLLKEKERLGNNYYIFEYDAWGHQEDLQRRSFLETLTNDLINNKKVELLPEKCSRKNIYENKFESWEDKLKYLLARKRETKFTSKPKISKGIISSILVVILTPIITAAVANEENISLVCKILIGLIPIGIAFIFLLFLLLFKITTWSDLFEIYSGDKIKDIINETISENEPSVKEFKDWMQDLSDDLIEKRLIIVFDNMDRLPAEKVKELWSSIHTFFSEDGYKNIWVIIPFDREHLANAFGERIKSKNLELACQFINKTFPVIYKVAPPITTDWEKIFMDYFYDAFGEIEKENQIIIQKIYGRFKYINSPRYIIAFINELVSLKFIWREQIPLIDLAIYAVYKEELKINPINFIVNEKYTDGISDLIKSTEKLQENISAIYYNIDANLAKQIPLKQFIRKSLTGDQNYVLKKLSDYKYFIQLLEEEIKRVNPSDIDKAIFSLETLDIKDNAELIMLWNKLVEIQMTIPTDKLIYKYYYSSLLINSQDLYRRKMILYLYKGFINIKEFNGNTYYIAMNSIEKCLIENSINISLDEFVQEKEVQPNIFYNYMNIASEDYKKFKLTCDNKALNEFLISKFPAETYKMNFISYLENDQNYNFELLKNNIEEILNSDNITLSTSVEIIPAYKVISDDKPLKYKISQPLVQQFLNETIDKNSEIYYDLVAMALTHELDVNYSESLAIKVAERIEFYANYGDLILLSLKWSSVLLRNVVAKLTLKSYGKSIINIEKILPRFDEILNTIGLIDSVLLDRLNGWHEDAENKINESNLVSYIPKYSFYNYSTNTKNDLTDYLNKVIISKISNLTLDELVNEKDNPTSYWLNSLVILIKSSVLDKLPENFDEFCKIIIIEISNRTINIPLEGTIIDVILKKVNKNLLKPKLNEICKDYCNKTLTITPELFFYLENEFNLLDNVKDRDGDIANSILKPIIENQNCLNYIIRNKQRYIKIIKNAGDFAIDLKTKIKQILQSNSIEGLKEFAIDIGIVDEEIVNEQ